MINGAVEVIPLLMVSKYSFCRILLCFLSLLAGLGCSIWSAAEEVGVMVFFDSCVHLLSMDLYGSLFSEENSFFF